MTAPAPVPDPARRRRVLRAAAWAGAGLLALLLAAGAAVWVLLPDRTELAQRVATRAGARLGVPVQVGSVDWQLWPMPRLVLTGIATQQAAPVRIDRVVAYPDWMAWVRDRRLVLHRLEAQGGTLPQAALREWTKRPPTPLDRQQRLVERLVFSDITWVSRRGLALAWSGDIAFDAGWRPRTGRLWRTDAPTPFAVQVQREPTAADAPDRFALDVEGGGGRATGWATLAQADDGTLQLEGQLKSPGVHTEQLMAAFKKRVAVGGRAATTSTFRSRADTPGHLVRNLRTRTDFRMAPATVLKFDIGRAVKTFGRETRGQTPLDSLTGRLETQNTADGIVMRYADLRATSGALTASGEATTFNRRVQARGAVDLVGGVVGVPFTISGSLDDPELSVSKGAAVGAAVGTVLLPGVGTALGLRIGESIGRLFD